MYKNEKFKLKKNKFFSKINQKIEKIYFCNIIIRIK
jgi:hypothetical protein